jgi:uncharacterized membrane protein required for colicin V production
MIPLLLCCGAFVIVFLTAQMGQRSGALLALGSMLGVLFGLLVALRFWFLASQWVGQHESNETSWSPLHSIVVFWTIFILVIFIASILRKNYTEVFESVFPSSIDRILGAAFGLTSGLVVVTALMMTLSIASPTLWPAYQSGQLPIPLDRYPLQAYRLIETRLAAIPPTDPAHTPLPKLQDKPAGTPAAFWQ